MILANEQRSHTGPMTPSMTKRGLPGLAAAPGWALCSLGLETRKRLMKLALEYGLQAFLFLRLPPGVEWTKWIRPNTLGIPRARVGVP